MRKVIIDTNMLLVPGQFKVDIFSEIDRVMEEPYELLILDGSLKELEKVIASGSSDDKRAAKLAKLLIEHQKKPNIPARTNCKGLKVISGSSTEVVDDAILETAEDVVATNDGALKRRLLEAGIRVIFLKQHQYLAMS